MHNSIENYLAASDGAGGVLAHARLLMKLERLYADIVPGHLGQASRVANCKSRTIVIHADNGAVAAKLRQMAPSLASDFSRKGVECSGVQVKVQARGSTAQSMASTQKPLSAQTGRTLRELAGSLPESPLRAALRTLLRRAAIRE